MTGKIIKGIGGLYYVDVEDRGLYACRAKGIFRKKKIKPNVGDMVEIEILDEKDKEGNLTVIHERKNQLVRPMVANVDQALVVFSFKDPEPNYHLLNCFLIMMESQDIPVIICMNKCDLTDQESMDAFRENYAASGCRLCFISAIKEEGLDTVRELILGRTTVMAGPSGVGKSSLLNALCGKKQMETGAVSEKIRRGRHTTRHSELIPVGHGTYLMDTPGFSSLALPAMDKETLKACFAEFAPHEGNCRFLDCCHENEPDCAVKQAVEEGAVSRHRYQEYLAFLEEVRQQKKW